MASSADPEGSSVHLELQISRQEVLNCALPSWYPQFKSITPKSVFIPLSEDFVTYLNSDGIVLPEGCALPSPERSDSDNSEVLGEKIDWNDSGSDSDTSAAKAPSFPTLVKQIADGIESMGGAALPKLNWSAPRDATWMSPDNSLRCTCPAEVVLLLKSSDFIAHDLSRVFQYCTEVQDTAAEPLSYTLCLRRWIHMHPAGEFRCFVYKKQLIAISQRDHTAYYSFLANNKEKTRQAIVKFFHKEIEGKFPNKNFIFDIYRAPEDGIQLLDFNPYCPATDPLMFTWEELASGVVESMQDLPVFRIVEGERSIQPSDLQSCRLPKDIVDLSSGEDAHKFVDLFKSKRLGQDLNSSDSESGPES